MYCLPGSQGNEPFFNGLYENNTYHCDIGVFCRGGIASNRTYIEDEFQTMLSDETEIDMSIWAIIKESAMKVDYKTKITTLSDET